MSAVICDAMDCKHLEPMESILSLGPYMGTCKREIVNICKLCGGCQCISYERVDVQEDVQED